MPSTEKIPEDLLAGIDGIVLSGGGDLFPELYGEAPMKVPTGSAVSGMLMRSLVPAGREPGVPMLAICRGLQLINVLRGGNLQLHID